MKVFISWSGPQSNYIARALRGWLCEVIQTLDPWMSEVNIEAGQLWANELAKGLKDSHFGVVCLTAENLQSSWLHYEAGTLTKTVEGRRVCPYLYKIEPSVVVGPLSLLQMKQADEQGTKELVQSINTVIKELNEKDLLPNEKSLSPEQLDKAFRRCWGELEKELNAVPLSSVPSPQRETREMVEEILEIVRNQSRPPLHTEPLNLFDADEFDRHIEPEDGITLTPIRSGGVSYLVNPKGGATLTPIRSGSPQFKRRVQKGVAQEPPLPSDTPQEEKTPSK